MDKKPETNDERQAREKAEARTARMLGFIFGGLIVFLIAGMVAIDVYGEKVERERSFPAVSADH